jgi:osmoprotectant transport system ATP-binding protein
MITVDRISKTFDHGKMAVDNVSFEVAEGETLILLGTSGCGKTTTLRMINRLIEPSGGNIYVNGKNIRDLPQEELRRGMGYVLQDSGLFPHYTVAENVGIVPGLLGWDLERTRRRTSELLEKLHLPPAEYMNAYPGTLSGGQQQRVGLARALAADQPVLLMDEPFGALDPVTRAHVRKDFRTLDEISRKTVILVTHDVSEALELGDRICLMHEGKIAQWGAPTELLLKPASEFVRSFFQDGRLELELRVVRIRDVWSSFPAPEREPDGILPVPDMELRGSSSLWEVLQKTNTQPGNRVRLHWEGHTRSLTGADVMTAFSRYKDGLPEDKPIKIM